MIFGDFSIRLMTAADVPLAMVLKAEAGWNQVEADWLRFLDMQPDGCFVAEMDGEPVGTTVTCVFGEVGWVAMVLVAQRVRSMGIGTLLVGRATSYLHSQDVQSVRLDATPLGTPIYKNGGFQTEYSLARYEGVLGHVDLGARPGDMSCCVRAAWQGDLQRVVALDREVTGTSRERLLRRLYRESPQSLRLFERAGEVLGYLAIRRGTSAVQIGPCIGSFEAGSALLADVAARLKGQRVFVDVPERHRSMMDLVEGAGLTVQRTFLRMCRGPFVCEDPSRLLASSGPELG